MTTKSGASQEAENHPAWEPEWISGFFTTSAHCSNRECRETAVLLGEMKVDADVDEHGHWQRDYETFLRLRYVEPPLGLVKLPERCPPPVQDAIVAASRVMWSDTSSAANRLRAAVEELLTAMNVRKMTSARKRMTTHARIELLQTTRAEVAATLEAVKWIGNAGSHAQTPSIRDVLEGAALLEHALRQVYDTSEEELTRLAKQINKRRGRPSNAR